MATPLTTDTKRVPKLHNDCTSLEQDSRILDMHRAPKGTKQRKPQMRSIEVEMIAQPATQRTCQQIQAAMLHLAPSRKPKSNFRRQGP